MNSDKTKTENIKPENASSETTQDRLVTGLPNWDLLPPASILRRPSVGR